MAAPLADEHCRALPKGTPSLSGPAITALLGELSAEWRVASGPVLARAFRARDYGALVRLAALIGALAEAEDHHPDLELRFGELEVSVSTHTVGGLSRNDFVLAARIDRLGRENGF